VRILVCGTREWDGAWEEIAVQLPDHCDPNIGHVTIIHGACSRLRGGVQVSVDMLADFIAHRLGFTAEPYPVDHRIDGPWPAAGPRRNARMLSKSKPDRGLAFGALWKPHPSARAISAAYGEEVKSWKHTGTGGMVAMMLRAGLPVRWDSAPGAAALDLLAMPEAPR